jgi:hypothetical protein
MGAAEVERQRTGRLDGDACCFGEVELLTEFRE